MTFDVIRGVAGRWRCKKRSNHRGQIEVELAAADNTWFSGTRLSIEKAMLLTYCWSKGFNYEQAIDECHFNEEQRISSETVADWYSYCREVSMIALDSLFKTTGRIGGEGHIVEIDETKIGKRKYQVGRIVEGNWILGMLNLGSVNNPRPVATKITSNLL